MNENVKYYYYIDYIKRHVADGDITELDGKLILEHIDEREICSDGLSDKRKKKITFELVGWRKKYGINKEFTECSYNDLANAIRDLKKKTNLAKETRRDYISCLKYFFYFLVDEEYSEIPLKKLKKIKIPPRDYNTKKNIPDQEEIKKMIDTADTEMKKAFLYMMYEGGFRFCEMLNMKWNQLHFENNGEISITVCAKTDKPRFVSLLASADHLRRWKNLYPLTPEGDNYVFITKNHEQLKDAYTRKVFKEIVRKAGITKNITPSKFRDARVIDLMELNTQENKIKEIFWANQNTQQMKSYLIVSNREIRKTSYEANRLEFPEIDEKYYVLEAKRCSFCNHINPGDYKICGNCNNPLEAYSASHLEQFAKAIEETPEFEMIKDIIQKIASSQKELPN